jgi:hypothetical protein
MSKTMFMGVLIHTLVGALLAVVGAPFWCVGLAFWMKEYGEAKHVLPGTIWSTDKQIEMLKYTVAGNSSFQWALPAIAAYAVHNV